jgi:hypothetical protein
MAREIEHVRYFKIETAGAASKLRELIRLGGDAIEGPWDGEEAITLLPDLDAGATGAMTGGGYPDGIRPIIEAHRRAARDAIALPAWLPLINYENRQAGLLAAKALMKEGGVIACEAPRHPLPPMHPDTRAGLIETAKRLDPLVLRWGKDAVLREVGQRVRCAVRPQVSRACGVGHPHETERPRDELGIAQNAHAQHAVEALVHQVDAAVGGADADLQCRMPREEFGQARNDKVARQGGRQIDAQAPREAAGVRAEHGGQLLSFGEVVPAAVEEALAVFGEPHAARGALQEPCAQTLFEVLHGDRDACAGQAELVRGAAEARELGDPREDAQFVGVHGGRLFLLQITVCAVWRNLSFCR